MLKVIDKKNNKEVGFGTLKPLDVFKYKGDVYITGGDRAPLSGGRVALNISTGNIDYLYNATVELVEEAELHIKD